MLKSEEDFKFSHLPNHPVYVGKFFELFACQRCGVCCNSFGGVPVSEQEVIRISADLKIDADIFRGKYTVTAGNIMSLKQPCPFSTKEGCQIYEDRPENCRRFPVVHAICNDDIDHFGVWTKCPRGEQTLNELENRLMESKPYLVKKVE